MRRGSLAGRRPLTGALVNAVLAAALALLGVGLFGPLMSVEKFYVFSNRVSLFSGLVDLAGEGRWALFAVLGSFSVALPLLKLGLLFRVWNLEAVESARQRRHIRWMAHYGKWSMLDVFVVAVLVVSVKLGSIARVEVHYGLYAFAASVLLTMAANQWVLVRAGAAGGGSRSAGG
ncbi:MAG: paraquat-inducible protein A [Chromatiales bacterium]|jgi:paraquat-inducible protein A